MYELAKKDGIVKDDLKDVYHKNFVYSKKTYLNRLFRLLNEYTERGSCISPKTMSLLTNRTLRRLKVNWLLYMILKIRHIHLTIPRRIKYLLLETFKDIRRGDCSRTIRYLKHLLDKRIGPQILSTRKKI